MSGGLPPIIEKIRQAHLCQRGQGPRRLRTADNAWSQPLSFELPPTVQLPGGRWQRWLDTSLPSPDDIVPLGKGPVVEGASYLLPPHTVAVVVAGSAV